MTQHMDKFLTAILDDVQRFTFYSAGADSMMIREALQPVRRGGKIVPGTTWVKTGQFDMNINQCVRAVKRLQDQGAVMTKH